MALIKIGELITISNEKNTAGKDLPFYGININKEFMPTVANTQGIDGSKYKIIKKNRFVFSGMQTGRDGCIRIGLYEEDNEILISPAYTTFEVSSPLILPEYLFMLFKSEEMDRYGAFLSDSSVRSNLDWERFIDIEIELPSIEIQKKYVDIYKGLKHNLKVYQSKLEEIKMVYEGFVENCGQKEKIGDLIFEVNEKNTEGLYDEEKGVSIEKKFIPTKASSSDITKQKVVGLNTFAFNSNTSRNSDTISIALNLENPCIVSNTYVTFKTNEEKLNPKYLFLWFRRKEFDRYARFNSWGSARETLSIKEIQDYKISIPTIEKQNSVAKILDVYFKRKEYVERLKNTINGICPILIRGAVKEAKNG